jgi:hypothetical protein
MTNLTTKDKVKYFVSVWAEKIKLYFNNLWDALLGRTQGFIQETYTIIDGISEQVYELMLDKERLQKQIETLSKKPAKKTATVAQKKPVKKTTKKASGK